MDALVDPPTPNLLIFSFYIFANSLCTYVKIQFTCSFTIFFLILILIYSLYIITNPTTFSGSLLNNSSLATSGWNPCLNLRTIFFSPFFICYNSSSSVRAKYKPYIRLTQENLMEFQLQSIVRHGSHRGGSPQNGLGDE